MNAYAKYLTVLVAVFLCLSFAHAETLFKFGGPSFHTTSSNHTNSFHRTAILSHRNYFAGYFKNSYSTDSFVIGKSFVEHQKDVDLVFHAGAVWGYKESSSCYKSQDLEAVNDKKIICPLIAPEIILHKLPLKPSVAWFGFDALVFNLNYTF